RCAPRVRAAGKGIAVQRQVRLYASPPPTSQRKVCGWSSTRNGHARGRASRPSRNFFCSERDSERVAMKTLYDLLRVRSDANAEAVKKAFRRAVKAHHPDLNADEDAAERFRKIIAANAILRDIEQRAAYDRHLKLERQRLWLEWKRAVVHCLIAAAVSSAA